MPGTIGDLIWQMAGKEDPRAALMASVAGGGTSGTPGPASDTSGAAGIGGDDPATAGTSTAPTPESLKSTPDMVDLYTQLADKEAFNHSINTGIGLILSSMAYDENKDSIEQAFIGGGSGSDSLSGGGGTDALDFVSKTMKLRQDQAALAQTAAHRAALPAIAKQYGIDLATAQYLFDTGKLDTIIQEAEKPNKEITKGSDGRTYIVDKTDGTISAPLDPAPKREIEVIEDENTHEKIAVYKDDKTPVAGREPIVKGVRKTEYLTKPDGSMQLVFSDDKTPVGRGDIASIGSTEKSKLWHDDMVDRAKRGLPEIPLNQWLEEQAREGKTDADTYGNPPTDMAWKRDEKGNIIVKDGIPQAVPIPGTKLAAEAEKAAKAEEVSDDTKSKTANIVSEDIDRAIKLIEDNSKTWLPVTGFGGLLANMPNSDAGELAGMFDTIKGNIGFDKLNAIRAGNVTGGGLGPVSDFENQLLQSTFGSLKQTGQEKNLVYNLRRIQALYNAVITKGIKNQAEANAILAQVPRPKGADQEQPGIDPEVDALVNKYIKKEK